MSTNGRTHNPSSTGSNPSKTNPTIHSSPSILLNFNYPSITEDLLDRVISWAKSLTEITEEQISVIKHVRKSLLFYSDKTWVKKSNDSLFDLTMGSYDGAEVSELVGLFILNKLSAKFGQEMSVCIRTMVYCYWTAPEDCWQIEQGKICTKFPPAGSKNYSRNQQPCTLPTSLTWPWICKKRNTRRIWSLTTTLFT